jgi:hypothetical protein
MSTALLLAVAVALGGCARRGRRRNGALRRTAQPHERCEARPAAVRRAVGGAIQARVAAPGVVKQSRCIIGAIG